MGRWLMIKSFCLASPQDDTKGATSFPVYKPFFWQRTAPRERAIQHRQRHAVPQHPPRNYRWQSLGRPNQKMQHVLVLEFRCHSTGFKYFLVIRGLIRNENGTARRDLCQKSSSNPTCSRTRQSLSTSNAIEGKVRAVGKFQGLGHKCSILQCTGTVLKYSTQ
jgi:hypothetical protein